MDDDETISIHSDEDESPPQLTTRRELLQPVITRVIDALGGYESGVYRLGDECLGCLKDLKKLWRKDDDDDARTVARIFYESRVFVNDLVPILLETAGRGMVEDKRAVVTADLVCAMTWPVDVAEELKELDEEDEEDVKGLDYTQLLAAHLQYKLALLKPGVIPALFALCIPPLSKTRAERTERDGQIVAVVLHLVRNLAFIKDLPVDPGASSDRAEYAGLQSRLVRVLEESHVLQLLLTIAVNADRDPLFESWNTLVMEILYLLFRGIRPTDLAKDQEKATEARTRRDVARTASSRHSRFGTTIAVQLNTNNPTPTADQRTFVLHRQSAISTESASVMDITKRQVAVRKGNRVDQLTREENLSLEARLVLRRFASEFVRAAFNPFLASVLKDIRSERAKITEKDNVRLLWVTKWFLEFFLAMRTSLPSTAQDKGKGKEKEASGGGIVGGWVFGLVAEVFERSWIGWVLRRMRNAVEDKPKQWTELQTGIECLTQLLLIVDAMSSTSSSTSTESHSDDEAALAEAADTLKQQIIYNGEVLEISLDSLRAYKPGTQTLVFLDASVYLAWVVLRVLEKWSRGMGEKDVYVQRRKKAKKGKGGKKSLGEEGADGVPEEEEPDKEEDDEEEGVVHETMFTFEAFEMKFAHADITATLLAYLARYKEFASTENMRRVVSTLHLFKLILADQKSFPREQPYKDLVNLITFVLRQFFKALAEDTFLAVEAYFPKNRGQWKAFSSWEPEKKDNNNKSKTVEDRRFPPDVEVKKGYSWSDQLGIAIAALVDGGEIELVNWTKDILTVVTAQRQRIIDETDRKEKGDGDEDGTDDEDAEAAKALRLKGPSSEAMAKITDYLIPYLSDEQADAATKNPHLKLLFRLCKFFILDEEADEMEWYVPAAITPSDLQSTLTVINQFLVTPFDLEGKNASELLAKKRRRRRRARRPSPSMGHGDSDADGDDDNDEDEPGRRKRKEKKKKEKELYKSAQFIEDSDEEYGDIEAFLEKEKALRAKTQAAATAGDGDTGIASRPNMKSRGTKKRRRKTGDDSRKRARTATGDDEDRENSNFSIIERPNNSSDSDMEVGGDENHNSSNADDPSVTKSVALPRPKPRPIAKRHASLPDAMGESSDKNETPLVSTNTGAKNAKRNRLVISDEEED
ncbi:hypothetical protein H0H92_012503 [Tricholoma furcatifolium]|nr:hypothetical protein H0H92_012503 [Tricholoma furcatifolium]